MKFFFFLPLYSFSSSFARGPLHSSLPSGLRNGSGISYSGSVRRELFQDKQSKLIGNVHGDEPVGRELPLRLANRICDNYAKESSARLIVENAHLHILPSMNPDGCFLRRRGNVSNIDLNRDFPDQGALVANYPWDGSEDKKYDINGTTVSVVMATATGYKPKTTCISLGEAAMDLAFILDPEVTAKGKYECL